LTGADAYRALGALAPGVTVVTVNKRLARALQREHAVRERAAGRTAWETPDILPWRAWLQRSWEALLHGAALGTGNRAADLPGMLLDPLQERVLWSDIVRRSPTGEGLLRPEAAARLAIEAHALRAAWIPETTRIDASSRDVRAFLDWSRSFDMRCRDEGWIDAARLPDLLADAWKRGALPLPPVLYLAGFDELTLQQRRLFDMLAGAGTRIIAEPLPEESAAGTLEVFNDVEAESFAAACWARRCLERSGHGGGRIAIVTPEPGPLLRMLDEVLDPVSILPGRAPEHPLYDVSLGEPLADWPVVRAALTALELTAGTIALTEAGALLRSPFLAGAETEMTARGLLDARLRRQGMTRVSVDDLISAASKEGPQRCDILVTTLRLWRRELRGLPERMAPSAWAERVLHLLHVLGWPGERPLDSREYQTVEAWRELVSRLSSLDRIRPALSLGETRALLAGMAAERIFQPEGAEDAPIQVLGMLEAAVMRFDHLRVLGMHDGAWPPVPDPNPFLPLALQRQLGIPGTTPEGELGRARRLLDRLRAAAPEPRFSHAAHEGDRELRVSPLVDGMPAPQPEAQVAAPLFRTHIHDAARLERHVDAAGTPFAGVEAPGGTKLFQYQAQCPFRAYAALRLEARPLDDPEPGPDARLRGTIMHRALDLLWRELGGSARLHALADSELEALLAQAVDGALDEFQRHYTRNLLEVERGRLRRRLREWLEIERARMPFEVEQLEEEQQLTVGGLRISMRIDRVDRLSADGRPVLIDYKTGKTEPKDWFGERPAEPQLPLYSLALGNEDVAGLLYGSLKPGSIGYVGVTDEDGIIIDAKGVRSHEQLTCRDGEDWEAQRMFWKDALERLARDFRAGCATVDPLDPPASCRYCGLETLCRIGDGAAPVDDAPEAEA
jgi:probable DNA repair protein